MPIFVIAKPLADGAARDVVLEAVTVDRWRGEFTQAIAAFGGEIVGNAADGMGLSLLVARPGGCPRRRRRLRWRPPAPPMRAARRSARTRRAMMARSCGRAAEQGEGTMSSLKPVRPEPRAEVMAIDAYVPGKSAVAGLAKVHKLSSNKSPLGASPKAIEAFRANAGELAIYPDGSALRLREAIAKRFGLGPEQIICGNGSDELISLLAHVYLRPGDEGLYSQYGFLEYPIAIRAAGGIPVVAEERDETANVDALLAKVTAKTKIVYLANPNNPTGTYLPFAEVKRLHAGLPPHVLLALDAAYAEYVTRNDYAAGIELVATSQNVVMLRTFSKIYGLANLRIGWAYAPTHVIDALNRVRGPFNLNGAAIAAGAAAIEDAAHVAAAAEHNARWLPWLAARDRQARGRRDARGRQFPAAAFPRSGGQNGGRRRPLPQRQGIHLARRRGLRAARLLADDRRRRGGEPRRRGGFGGVHDGRAVMTERLGPPLGAPLFERLALIGVGLIGSSIARGARRKNLARVIAIADASPEARASAAALKLGDEVVADPAAAAAGADLVILCVPVGADEAVARAIAPKPASRGRSSPTSARSRAR